MQLASALPVSKTPCIWGVKVDLGTESTDCLFSLLFPFNQRTKGTNDCFSDSGHKLRETKEERLAFTRSVMHS